MDVFDLVAKIRLDKSEYEQGLGDAKGGFSSLASGVKNGLATVGKIGAAAVSAGVAGVAALTKMGVEGYAQYEQLVGGVETLFKDSQATVMSYAENAYKTSGMSANQYMETVTSFSASLIQSLDGDTAKAAEVADMAITDMSDNANKMGTSIDMIQNAYNGFAKGNFTMLDNLKLGYGGTQEEMKRLLADAEKISGIKYDISSFADVTEAIHVMQEEMGIAGTTAREASSTIEGSLSMMKGAWENLVVGMADSDANMDVLISNFVESVGVAAQNLLPRIEQTIVGIGQLIEKLAPIIGEALPRVIEAVLPSLLAAGISLITALVSGIITAAPALYQALLDAIHVALTSIFGMSEESATSFVSGIDNAIRLLVDFFNAGFAAISNAFNWLVTQAQTEGTVLNGVWETIKTVVSNAISIIENVVKMFTAILKGDWSAAWEHCKSIVSTVWETIGAVLDGIVSTIISFLGTMVENGFELISSFANGMQEKFAEFITAIVGWITDNIVAPIMSFIETFVQSGRELITSLKDGAYDGFIAILSAVGGWMTDNIISPILSFVGTFKSNGKELITSLKNGAYEGFVAILGAIGGWVNNNIISPILSFAGTIKSNGKTLIVNLKNGAADGFGEILSAVGGWVTTNIISPITSMGSDLYDAGVDLLDNFWDGLTEAWDKILKWWNGLKFPNKEKPTFDDDEGTPAATGLNYVPYDEFPAILHRGEAVLTAAEARIWRKNGLQPAMAGGGGITINQYIQSVPQTAVEFANATEAYFEQARWML